MLCEILEFHFHIQKLLKEAIFYQSLQKYVGPLLIPGQKYLRLLRLNLLVECECESDSESANMSQKEFSFISWIFELRIYIFKGVKCEK